MEAAKRTLMYEAFRSWLDRYGELTGVYGYGAKNDQPIFEHIHWPIGHEHWQYNEVKKTITNALYKTITSACEKYLAEKKYGQLGFTAGFIQGAIWVLGIRSMEEIQRDNVEIVERLTEKDEDDR